MQAEPDFAGKSSVPGFSRRRFISGALAAFAVPYIVPSSVLGAPNRAAPSERIRIGIIGMGSRGNDHLGAYLGKGNAQVMAVCDPYQAKREGSKKRAEQRYASEIGAGTYKGCAAYADFRELVTRDDIDAVAIASPEYWHALHSTWAMLNGKDVYQEKAMTLTVAEGRALIENVRRHQRIFQLGTQQRSDGNFRHACELARNGYLGKLHTVKVSVPGGRALGVAQPKPVPADIDYEMWLGPAPYRPFNDQLCSFNWYFIYDFCIGWIGSWGVHHIDIALWGAPVLAEKPIEIEGSAVFPKEGQADTSISWKVDVAAADGLKMHFTDDGNGRHGARFEGDKGWVHVTRGGIQAEPASLLKLNFSPNDERLYVSNDHIGNFLDCIRSRRDPVAPVEAGHQATTMTILSDIATRTRRKLTWDWKAERFQNDDVANTMLARPMRSPWTL